MFVVALFVFFFEGAAYAPSPPLQKRLLRKVKKDDDVLSSLTRSRDEAFGLARKVSEEAMLELPTVPEAGTKVTDLKKMMANAEVTETSNDAPAPAVTEELLMKVREYLAVRSSKSRRNEIIRMREETMANPIWRAGNYLFSLESFLPKIPKDPGDPLDYTEMSMWGYDSLVVEVIRVGGRAVIAAALGMELPSTKFPEPPPKPDDNPVTGRIALGAAREQRVDAIVTGDNKRQKYTKFYPGITKPRTIREEAPPPRKKKIDVVDDKPPPTEWPVALAPMGLSLGPRIYGSCLFFTLAAQPDAPATRDLLTALPSFDGLFDVVHDASFVLLLTNLAAAIVSAFLVLTGESSSDDEKIIPSVVRAVFCALIGGPLATLDLRRQAAELTT